MVTQNTKKYRNREKILALWNSLSGLTVFNILWGSIAACLAWSIPASFVLFLCAGNTYTRWLVITISSSVMHSGKTQEPWPFVCSLKNKWYLWCWWREQLHAMHADFVQKMSDLTATVDLVKLCGPCVIRFNVKHPNTKRCRGIWKMSSELQNADKFTERQDLNELDLTLLSKRITTYCLCQTAVPYWKKTLAGDGFNPSMRTGDWDWDNKSSSQ